MSALNTGALHPLASSGASTEKRVYEPSMEEILASIRRIIADDQSLPGRGAEQDERPRVAPPVELRRTPAPPELFEAPRPEPIEEPQQAGERAPDPVAPVPPQVAFERVEPAASNAGSQATQTAHGTIAAPQYAMPDRAPVEHLDVAPPPPMSSSDTPQHAAHDAVDALHQVSLPAAAPQPSPTAELSDTYAVEPDAVEPHLTEPDMPVEPPALQQPADAPSLFSEATDSSVAAAFNMLAASRLAGNSDEIMNLVREMIRPLLRSWLDDNLPSMVERMVRAEIERVARGGR